jgi:SpoVK/Ycf46/Vps4 family AAA+-type ATPase
LICRPRRPREIFKVHLSKRALESERFDLEKLVEKSKDFSGAEIEGAVKDGVLEAFIDGDREAETKDIIKAIDQITPTAVMMSEKIEEIRAWARKISKARAARRAVRLWATRRAQHRALT